MHKTLHIGVETHALRLSRTSQGALRHHDRYDIIAFTSKNARRFFDDQLIRMGVALPTKNRVLHVGPREDVLKHAIDDKRILFPRSDIAPADILDKLRARGAVVRSVPLYTAIGKRLSSQVRKTLTAGAYDSLYFKSPSGVSGLLRQFRGKARQDILKLEAICIGDTTAAAARAGGFKKVSIKGIL